jgi:REP element-mobilizing transposase RayT
MHENRIYLFVHAIFSVKDGQPLLKPSLRAVYFAWIKKHASEKAIRILNIGGGSDHVHLLLQLHPAQNLLQVVKQVKEESVKFISESKFLHDDFSWDVDYTAFSVSPGAFAQTMEYISKQDDYHQHKTFLQEMELINKTRINTDES